MKIRTSTREDQSVIYNFLGQAGLSTEGIEENEESFFLMEDESGVVQAIMGYEQEDKEVLLRSLVVSPTIYSQYMLLFLKSVMLKLSEKLVDNVYLLTKQSVVQDLFLQLGFQQVDELDVSEEVKKMNHYQKTIQNEDILVYKIKVFTSLSTD
jgi:N-acetylglutamate synthase-like GNAT family acetyltransferase